MFGEVMLPHVMSPIAHQGHWSNISNAAITVTGVSRAR